MDVMAGYAANPNIYGTVGVSLGCENCQMDLVVKAIEERTNKPLKPVSYTHLDVYKRQILLFQVCFLQNSSKPAAAISV